jgi:hypothetical protein
VTSAFFDYIRIGDQIISFEPLDEEPKLRPAQ